VGRIHFYDLFIPETREQDDEGPARSVAAIELLRGNGSKIDVPLPDITIPGVSSRDVAAKASQVCPDLKVILTGAYCEEKVMADMNMPGIRRFIRKPFVLANLVHWLRNVISS